ncbi:hypothetical protein FGRMN_4119 [Fusarium graminum]|nr:hypothetical protein FGRMN_4119 [Fusarium graminum]
MDNRANNIFRLPLDSNHTISRLVKAILILNPTVVSSAARLISMLITHRDIVRRRPQALRTTHHLLQEVLPEDTTLPTAEDKDISSLMAVSHNTIVAPPLCLTAPILNITGELTEGVH